MTLVHEKCAHYDRIGIAQIFVFDPERRAAWLWSHETENLERVHDLRLGNGQVLPVSTLWTELDRRIDAAKQ